MYWQREDVLVFDLTEALPWLILLSTLSTLAPGISAHQHSRDPSMTGRRQSHPQNWCFPFRRFIRSTSSSPICCVQTPTLLGCDPVASPHTECSSQSAHTPRTQECSILPPSFSRTVQQASLSLGYTHALLFPAAPLSLLPLTVPMSWRRQCNFPFIIRVLRM